MGAVSCGAEQRVRQHEPDEVVVMVKCRLPEVLLVDDMMLSPQCGLASKLADVGATSRKPKLPSSLMDSGSTSKKPRLPTKSRMPGQLAEAGAALREARATTRLLEGAGDTTAAGCQGVSLEEAGRLADGPQQEEACDSVKTPKDVLAELQEGNKRYCSGHASQPDNIVWPPSLHVLANKPSVAVLGCSDFRVPIGPLEIVFDVGLGDIFGIRGGGDAKSVETTTQAFVQYAVNNLQVKVLVVMGGAVKASDLPPSPRDQDPMDNNREAVVTKVEKQLEEISNDGAVASKVQAGELLVVGAFYEVSSGLVDFFSGLTSGRQPFSCTRN
eukprot:TRINITY_DN91615_c0_g1_i1.p1 TRINITY_DN91615_c0_g1~~TRINITY_DN91615_c0_g1_i1.p1  ORF type:complete len:328 (-),score=55.43 TRINITY_DN91615_c0_g1_i1:522-1505(-)